MVGKDIKIKGKYSSMMKLMEKSLREVIVISRKNLDKVINRQVRMSHTKRRLKKRGFKQK
jgi:hypothetical protein